MLRFLACFASAAARQWRGGELVRSRSHVADREPDWAAMVVAVVVVVVVAWVARSRYRPGCE